MSNELKSVSELHPLSAAQQSGLPAAKTPPPGRQDELRLLVNSRHPIITVETTEEERLERLLADVAAELDVPFYTWSVTSGLARSKGAPLYNSDAPEQVLANIDNIHGDAIFLLKDFARYCETDKICRRIRDIAEKFRAERRSLVILAAAIKLPPDLQGDAVPFHLGLPTADELLPRARMVIDEVRIAQQFPGKLGQAGLSQLARNLAGLSQEEAMRTLRKCLLARRRIDDALLDDVLTAKHNLLRSSGPIETIRRDSSFADVAGMSGLRQWIAKRKSALTPEGRRFGLEPPKGILITGVQGCGKSLAAKAVAGEWGYELARLDAGALYEKFVGESEKRLQ